MLVGGVNSALGRRNLQVTVFLSIVPFHGMDRG